ncbi:Rho GTPase-activating protein 26 [Lamellibrachia satsuma]|nr:Rho GTPase-activating protein 26 [Lamellibrachia satsuma]
MTVEFHHLTKRHVSELAPDWPAPYWICIPRCTGRQKLHSHEKELEKTSKWIKGLIGECKDILSAAKSLSKAQRSFSNTLTNFKFECIGNERTDDEKVIANSMEMFGKLISTIEDERDRMLDQADVQIIRPLENFRKERIGQAKNGKKKFDKHTAKFCQSLEKYLNLKTKAGDTVLKEADVVVEEERRQFCRASMEYVVLLQEVQERKKFEFVETLLTFLYSWLTFFHVGHDVYKDFKPYTTELQQCIQKCRGNFDSTKLEAETLMEKMLEVRGTKAQQVPPTSSTREGYLFLMEKKALVTSWNKYYCLYQKENKIFTMIPFIAEALVTSWNKYYCLYQQENKIFTMIPFIAEALVTSWNKYYCLYQKENKIFTMIFLFLGRTLVTSWNKYYCLYQKENKIFTMIPFIAEALVTSWNKYYCLYQKENKIFTMIPFIAEALVTSWNKYYCLYQKENKIFTMIPFIAEALVTSWNKTRWNKYYCLYQKENKIFTMIPFNQVTSKSITTETFFLTSCTRRASDTIEKRFCFDVKVQDRPSAPLTLQANSEEDLRLWLNAMDGKEPIYSNTPNSRHEFDSLLDDVGFNFIKKCVTAIENRGLEEQGLYRVVGVSSKINKLTSMGLDKGKVDKIDLDDPREYEVKTITSGLKNYFRTLPEPLMTYKLHDSFIAASKRESPTLRINDIHELVHQLPEPNFEMLDYLVAHLQRVADQSSTNLMTVVNIAVCFGPTLMRSRVETMAAILNIKFCNIVVEILIDNYEKIFKSAPEGADITNSRVLGGAVASPRSLSHAFPRVGGSDATARLPYIADQNNYSMDRSDLSGQSQTRWRPSGGYYSPVTLGGERTSSTSSSTESLGSKGSISCQFNSHNPVTSVLSTNSSKSPTLRHNNGAERSESIRGHVPKAGKVSHYRNEPVMSTQSPTSMLSAGSFTGSTSSVSSVSSGQTAQPSRGRTARTLYSCEAENESELSFEPNQIIHCARISREPGWLEGILDGKVGLVPSNYVEFLD